MQMKDIVLEECNTKWSHMVSLSCNISFLWNQVKYEIAFSPYLNVNCTEICDLWNHILNYLYYFKNFHCRALIVLDVLADMLVSDLGLCHLQNTANMTFHVAFV